MTAALWNFGMTSKKKKKFEKEQRLRENIAITFSRDVAIGEKMVGSAMTLR